MQRIPHTASLTTRPGRPRVLFVCTGNAGRSQIAEAILRRRLGHRLEVASAGVAPWPNLHPVACRMMAERGYSVEGQHPKSVEVFRGSAFDWVITLGGPALARCPPLAGNPRRLHWAMPDPAEARDSAEIEQAFRTAWGDIEGRLPALIALIDSSATARELHLAPGLLTVAVGSERFDPDQHLPVMARAGFRAIELCLAKDQEDFDWQDPTSLGRLRAVAADCGLPIWSVHAPCKVNHLASVEHHERRPAVEQLKRVLDVAAGLGAAVVPFHTGLSPARCAAGTHSKEAFLASLEDAARHAQPLPCVLGWENAPPGWVTFGPEELLALVRSFPAESLGFVCDTGHANLEGGDLPRYLPAAGPRLVSWHMNDNAGDADSHRLPGRGTVNWPRVIAGWVEINYCGPFMLELNRDSEDLQSFLEQAAQTAKNAITTRFPPRSVTPAGTQI